MGKRLLLNISILLLVIGIVWDHKVFAAGSPVTDVKNAEASIDLAINFASKGNLSASQNAYGQFNQSWQKIEDGVKEDSAAAYKDIEEKMGQVVYSFTLKKQDQVLQSLQVLKNVNEKFIHGGYPRGTGFKSNDLSLDNFILILQKAK